MRLVCPRCSAGLVPSWAGLRCPRLGACGRGGIVESALSILPLSLAGGAPSGVRA
jgi:hypothetical protein